MLQWTIIRHWSVFPTLEIVVHCFVGSRSSGMAIGIVFLGVSLFAARTACLSSSAFFRCERLFLFLAHDFGSGIPLTLVLGPGYTTLLLFFGLDCQVLFSGFLSLIPSCHLFQCTLVYRLFVYLFLYVISERNGSDEMDEWREIDTVALKFRLVLVSFYFP